MKLSRKRNPTECLAASFDHAEAQAGSADAYPTCNLGVASAAMTWLRNAMLDCSLRASFDGSSS